MDSEEVNVGEGVSAEVSQEDTTQTEASSGVFQSPAEESDGENPTEATEEAPEEEPTAGAAE